MKKKYIIISSILIIIALIIYLLINHKQKENVNNLVKQTTLEEASQKIIQKELNNKKLPIYQDIVAGNWDKVKEEINKKGKNIHWVISKTTQEILKNSELSKKISIKNYANFLWSSFNTNNKVNNILLLNITKLIQNNPNELIFLQDQINKKYYSIKASSNIKVLFLEATLSFQNSKSLEIFIDAIRSKNNNLIITAIRSVRNFNDPYVSKELIKLTNNTNKSIKATSFKILGFKQDPYAKKNIKTLIESKNAHFVEAALFIIKEMKLESTYKKLLIENIGNMEHFNKLKTQKLIDSN